MLGMRDIDRDFQTKIVVRRDAAIGSLTELHDRTVAVGSRDSVQARMLPLFFLKRAGVDLGRLKLLPFESDLGKHGDTVQSELDVLAAVQDGRAQAGAVGNVVWQAELSAGRIDPHRVEILWTTPAYDHHVLDALTSAPGPQPRLLAGGSGPVAETWGAFQRALLDMRWNNPKHRKLLELEGTRQWVVGRDNGYLHLEAALEDQRAW